MSASRTADLDGLIRSLSLRVTHHSPASPPRRNSVRWIRRSKGMSLAELVDHVIGVDPDRDRITAAVVCTRTQGEIASKSFATTARGHGHGQAESIRAVAPQVGVDVETQRIWCKRYGSTGLFAGLGESLDEENRRLRRARRSRVRERDRRRSPQGRTHPPIPRMTVHDRHRDRDRGLDHRVEHLTTPLSPRLPLAQAGGGNAHECSEEWLQKAAATPR